MGGISNNPGNVPIPPPMNQSQTGSFQIGQQGSNVSQSSSVLNVKDQFVSGNIATQTVLNKDATGNIQSNNPTLDPSYTINLASDNVNNLKGSGGTGNKWFEAQAIVAVSVALQELAYIMAKNKMTEGMMAADTILQMTQTALEIAKDIREEGQLKFIAGIAAGVASAVDGALSIAGSIHSGASGGSAAEMERIQMGYKGGGSLAQAGGQFVKAWSDLGVANVEAHKQMLQNMSQILSEKMKNLDDAVRSSDPDAVFQMLQKITDALYQSLGWR